MRSKTSRPCMLWIDIMFFYYCGKSLMILFVTYRTHLACAFIASFICRLYSNAPKFAQLFTNSQQTSDVIVFCLKLSGIATRMPRWWMIDRISRDLQSKLCMRQMLIVSFIIYRICTRALCFVVFCLGLVFGNFIQISQHCSGTCGPFY